MPAMTNSLVVHALAKGEKFKNTLERAVIELVQLKVVVLGLAAVSIEDVAAVVDHLVIC